MKDFKKEMRVISLTEESMKELGVPPLREHLIKIGLEKNTLKKMEREGLIKMVTTPLVMVDNKTGDKTPIGGKCLVNVTEEGRKLINEIKELEKIEKEKMELQQKEQGANEVITVEDLLKENQELK